MEGAGRQRKMKKIIEDLLRSKEPSIRYKTRVHVLGESPDSSAIRQLQEEIRMSPRVVALLSERGPDGRIPYPPYSKWHGAHWVLAALADLGYPPGDKTLHPLRDQVLELLTSREYETRWIRRCKSGPVRIHASVDGNAAWAMLTLKLDDARLDRVIGHLLDYQWPDGGWNCDLDAKGTTSSFDETLLAFRALALYARRTGNKDSKRAAKRASEVFLSRHMCWRRSNGRLIRPYYNKLHYPCYWHYDVLFGLRVMAEAGFIGDPRCSRALDLLESKRLPDGGFPSEQVYYQATKKMIQSRRSLISWGGVSCRHYNEWVTADALAVLQAARRL